MRRCVPVKEICCCKQFHQAILLWDGVIVHAPNPTSLSVVSLADTDVKATSTAKVTLRNHNQFLLAHQPFSGSIGTAIVYNDDPADLMRLLLYCLNTFLQQTLIDCELLQRHKLHVGMLAKSM